MKAPLPRPIEIARYWFNAKPTLCVDLVEHSCFACGWFDDDAPDLHWNRAKLERAHIVPEALGGPSVPSNLVLLCARCHMEAPNTPDRQYMLDWIRRREFFLFWQHREFERELNRAGFSMSDLEGIDFDEAFRVCVAAGFESLPHGTRPKCYGPSPANVIAMLRMYTAIGAGTVPHTSAAAA